MGLTNRVKTVLPWLCVVALGAGILLVRSRGKETETELAALRQANQELTAVRAENEELKKIRTQLEELGRLRKENEELHRLRNEVRQLREEKQAAAKAAQAAASSLAQSKTGSVSPQQLQQQVQQLQAENERLRAATLQFQQVRVESQANACINNLRIIEGAKDQWALENKKGTGDAVSAQNIQPYLRNNVVPVCPQGGVYTLNPLGALATCSIPGHVLPQQ
jgi:alanyl-tRNA synthetase